MTPTQQRNTKRPFIRLRHWASVTLVCFASIIALYFYFWGVLSQGIVVPFCTPSVRNKNFSAHITWHVQNESREHSRLIVVFFRNVIIFLFRGKTNFCVRFQLGWSAVRFLYFGYDVDQHKRFYLFQYESQEQHSP